ncbi:hypothetical protein B0H11DRAFT_2282327 [Mycena galericulata]|nr:hypothetical protein B0H11DRAFT_2282325 [Mycena galericulata]KAJ7474521.1 hypothetical protein B0H11DRAFT_2282327 [Mycena galericulata]
MGATSFFAFSEGGIIRTSPIQNASITLIKEEQHFIYIENQFFISSIYDKDEVNNQIARALVERIVCAAQPGKSSSFYRVDAHAPKVIVMIPELPAFSGNIKDEGSLKIVVVAQYRTIDRGGQSIHEDIRKAGHELKYIRFYHLYTYDRINAPLSTYVLQIEKRSGVKYSAARAEGGDARGATREWLVLSDKMPPKTETVAIPVDEDAAHVKIMILDVLG